MGLKGLGTVEMAPPGVGGSVLIRGVLPRAGSRPPLVDFNLPFYLAGRNH